MFSVQEIIKRIIKYLVEGIMVALVSYAIPKRSLDFEEIILIALTAAATFSVLDTYLPAMGASARNGTGLGIGLGLSGLPAML
jgi:ABC-type Co2+ transport system permease subunit